VLVAFLLTYNLFGKNSLNVVLVVSDAVVLKECFVTKYLLKLFLSCIFLPPFMKTAAVFLFQNNANSCVKSCAFLAQLQNFSSILAGDGTFPPTPGIPTVTSKNFTSISLKWDPVQNTSGAAVYLIEITFTGKQSRFSHKYLSEVNCPDIKNFSFVELLWV
jgi:hypothetical protein